MLIFYLLLCPVLLQLTGELEDCPELYEILAPGSYHGDDVTSAVDGAAWFGVFQTASGYELRLTELAVEEVNDPYIDHDNEKTAKLIYAPGAIIDPQNDWDYETDRWSSTDEDMVLFFLRPVDSAFNEGPLAPEVVYSPAILPDTTIELGNSGQSLVAVDKGLYLCEGETYQRLSSVYPDSHGECVTVIWAGDLDGDGRMDVILDDQSHYALRTGFRLFLSSEAQPDALVKEVADFFSGSC